RLPRPNPRTAGPALPGRATRASAHGGLDPEGDPRERRPLGRDRREAERGADEVPAGLQRRRRSVPRRLVASLQDIRRRIRSVGNTRKITRALELVAASKLRRAQARIEDMRPYADRMLELMAGTARASTSVRGLPLLQTHEQEQTVAIVPLTADRGLAGAFNSQILRRALALERRLRSEGKQVRWVGVGRRGVGSLRFRRLELAGEFTGFTDQPRYADAQAIAHRVSELYTNEEVDRVVLVYNHFESPLVQRVTVQDVLPLSADLLETGAEERQEDVLRGDFIFEPEPEQILE